MNKKKGAIIKISIISVLTALLLIFSFVSFSGYTGFYNAMQKGLELDKGIYANYTVERVDGTTDEEFAEDFNKTFLKIKSIIDQKNYQGATLYKGKNGNLRIETPKVSDAQALLSEIGAGELKIRVSNNSSDEAKIAGDDVVFAVATTSTTGYWGTYVQFTEEAANVLSNITESATSSSSVYLYFYRGNSEEYFFYLPVSSQVTADYLFISSSSGAMTKDDAINLAITISCGSMPAVVKIQGEVREISGLNGAFLGLSIALGVTALMTLILFALIYRELGLVVGVSILFYIGGMLFLIQAIPLIIVTSATLGAILAGLILVSGCNFIILEKIKKEYSIGKKLNISVKTGYSKAVNLIVDLCGVLALISLISYFIASGVMKGFMMILLSSSIMACLTSLLLTYILADSYATFNKNDGKRVNFTREDNINEIE